MKPTDITFYTQLAQLVSTRSHCKRRQVGAVIVTPDGRNILGYGYNGQPSGMDNCCEDHSGITKPTVMHAELNAIAKCAELGHSTSGSTMFITLSPCINCALLIIQSGIKSVYYIQQYKDTTGIELLQSSGVEVIHHEIRISH